MVLLFPFADNRAILLSTKCCFEKQKEHYI